MTAEIIGHYGQTLEKCEYLALSFSPLSAPLRSRWRNNGVSADFLGDYVTTFLPASDERPGAVTLQNEVRHAVTFIANEFLENAMKYHERDVDIPIGIRLELTPNHITVRASNAVCPEQAQKYKVFVEDILRQDAGELLLTQMAKGGVDPKAAGSCLGLLTMISDYNVQLGCRFEGETNSAMVVTTCAVLPLHDSEGGTE